MPNECQSSQKLILKDEILEKGTGNYYKCTTIGYILLGVFVLLVIVGLTFLFAWLKYSGGTQNEQVETTKVNLNYWGEWIEFLPDTLGGFLGIIVGFFFEATLFKKIKECNQRKTLCILLEEELKPFEKAETNPFEEARTSGFLLIIPTSECIMNSIEGSTLFNWQIKYKIKGEIIVYKPLNYIYNILNNYHKKDEASWRNMQEHCRELLNLIDNGRRKKYFKKLRERNGVGV